MKNKKTLSTVLYIISAVILIFIIDLFFLTKNHVETGFQKALVIICAVILAAIVVLIIYEATLLREREPNYFLYDKTVHKNISPENLTFKIVNDKMTLYISKIGETEESLWLENTLDKPDKIGNPVEFRTLLAYKMLYDLADMNDDKYWLAFYTWGENTVQSIADAIRNNGDAEMAATLIQLKNSFNADLSDIKDFLINNKPYIQSRMLKFVKANIELFC